MSDTRSAFIEQLCATLIEIRPAANVATLRILAQQHFPTMFAANNLAAQEATYLFFIEARKLNNDALPVTWFNLFRSAFDAGHISATTWGAAARVIYTGLGPMEKGYAGERHCEFLAGFRVAENVGMMTRHELLVFSRLPETVTIYRGAVAVDMTQAAQGISWSLSRNYAGVHVYKRKLNHHRFDDVLGMGPLKRPRLITATVPKEILFAYLGLLENEEVLVDYKLIKPEAVKELPMPSDAAVLMQSIIGGKAGRSGLTQMFSNVASS